MKLGALLVFPLAAALSAPAQNVIFANLLDFDGADGSAPSAGALIQATDGNLYGTTQSGGANGAGEVYQVMPTGEVNVFYSFCSEANCADGGTPLSGVLQAHDGNLYGTTTTGGANNCGTFYQVSLAGTFTVLHSFCEVAEDVFNAQGPLATFEPNGAPSDPIFGTAASGGLHGAGALFEFIPPNTYKVAHSFCSEPNCADGANPKSGLQFALLSNWGSWVGTTEYGGSNNAGVIFVANRFGSIGSGVGVSGIFYNFCSLPNCADGGNPTSAPLIAFARFYGVTGAGGANSAGAVYSLNPAKNVFTVLYSFCALAGCADGAVPTGLMIGKNSQFFGTTTTGGANGAGTVFELTRNGNTLYTVYDFCEQPSCADGGTPTANVSQGSNGALYGATTSGGANGEGTVYSITK
jgi:uncharacterized repeat protein (TIGR03803 family)